MIRYPAALLCLGLAMLGPLPVAAQAAGQPAPVRPRVPRSRGPSVGAVVRMALDAASETSPERVRGLMRRARLSGLVPSLRLGAERGLKQDLSATSSLQSERQEEALADDFSVEATLSFDLSRLVFASEEVRLLSVQRWLAVEQRKLIEQVVRLYFERKRLLREVNAGLAPDPELEAAVRETEALLDAFTAGGFGRALASAQP